jgi:hypothetical protein
VIFELCVYALAIYMLFRVVRLERYDAMLMIAAIAFTGFSSINRSPTPTARSSCIRWP